MYDPSHITNRADWREQTDQFRHLYDANIRRVPPRPPRQPADVSPAGLGLAAFVFALLGLIVCPFALPAVGIGLAVNHELRRRGRPANGLAAAAWLIGLVGCVELVAVVVLSITYHPSL